jgi:hypothetical protein
MTNSTKTWVIIILSLVILAGVFFFGYSMFPKWNPCPPTQTDTTYVHDTIIHHIPDTIPYYIVHTDSIIYKDQKWVDSVLLANKVDTTEILKRYYAQYYYDREWKDSLIAVQIHDVVSENKFMNNAFTYKLLQPQTIVQNIDNSKTYANYLQGGLDIPFQNIKYINLGVQYINPKFYVGLGYGPTIGIVVKGGFTILKFNARK